MPRPNPVQVLNVHAESWPAESTLIDRYPQGQIDHRCSVAADVVNSIHRTAPLQQGVWRRSICGTLKPGRLRWAIRVVRCHLRRNLLQASNGNCASTLGDCSPTDMAPVGCRSAVVLQMTNGLCWDMRLTWLRKRCCLAGSLLELSRLVPPLHAFERIFQQFCKARQP